ncbi:MAG: hypothetical protein ACI32C_04320 [Candidatus Enteromonas sp.]
MRRKLWFGLLGVALFSMALAVLSSNIMDVKAEEEEKLLRTIDFEDLPSRNMDYKARDNSYYDGLIVADGVITTTQKTQISVEDGNVLGARLGGNPIPESLKFTIQTAGCSRIALDVRLEKTGMEIHSGCGESFVATRNQKVVRDLSIPTHDWHEITLRFTKGIASDYATYDCGIDNIRFYGYSIEDFPYASSGTSTDSSAESSSSSSGPEATSSSKDPGPSREDTPAIVDGNITMRGLADYLETKDEHYPLSDEFIHEYQQTSGGYIDYAKKLGVTVDKAQAEPNQKWHFFTSWLGQSLEDNSLRWDDTAKKKAYSAFQCPELLLWLFEATGVSNDKVIAAREVAIEGKKNGTHTATVAAGMRACVPWEDIETNVLAFLNA